MVRNIRFFAFYVAMEIWLDFCQIFICTHLNGVPVVMSDSFLIVSEFWKTDRNWNLMETVIVEIC